MPPLAGFHGLAPLVSAIDHGPSVRVQHLPRHIGGILAGEKEESGSDLVRLPRPPHRRILAELLELFGTRTAAGIERGPDRSGGNRVHANAVFDQVLTERTGEGSDRPLAGAVVEQFLTALV